ncbi:UNVERIFIED_ORG: proline racemase [Rhizobium esperanzae]
MGVNKRDLVIGGDGREIARVSAMIHQAAIEKFPVAHPHYPGVGITISQLSGPTDDPNADRKNTVTMATAIFPGTTQPPGRVRSIAASAAPALARRWPFCMRRANCRYFRHQGILGNIYTGRLVEEARIGDQSAVVPTLSGTSWISGLNTLVLDMTTPSPKVSPSVPSGLKERRATHHLRR